MAEDVSLDQFIGESATDGRDDEGPDDDDPAEGVYRFDPGGAACASCGGESTARWRDGETFVCQSCKSW